MEPTLPSPHGSPEAEPVAVSTERLAPQGVEAPQSGERQETRERKVTADGGGQPRPMAPVVPQPLPASSAPVAAAPVRPIIPDTPATAGDDDLIEKEWVEKAKQVIAETRQDPYMQERAVSRLQADYLKKRYGKTIKLPEGE